MSQKQISYDKKLELIELVRERPALWDVRDPMYTNNSFKLKVWNEVSTKLGEDLEGRLVIHPKE